MSFKTVLIKTPVDDTPVDAAVWAAASSNWAYDHENASGSHSAVRAVTLVVAASDSTALEIAQSDYQCTGTNDHLIIQVAIDALPATGGCVLLLSGTYNIEASLVLDSYQTLRGVGRSTILTTTTANVDIITATGGSGTEKTGILITQLCIDGDATNDIGIDFVYVDDSKISNCWFIDNVEAGIYLESSDNNSISDNTCEGGSDIGIKLSISSYNSISSNNCYGNAGDGIYVGGNNTQENNNLFANICKDNNYGIAMADTENDVLESNICEGNGASGIGISSGCDFTSIIANICSGNAEYGILAQSSDNLNISLNTCLENSQDTTNTYDDILLSGVTYSLLEGNLCRAGGETNVPAYGINISDNGCVGVKVINNDLYDDGFGTASYNDSGTGTIYVEPGIDDTPVNGELAQPISSNWAYDHVASATPHANTILLTASGEEVFQA